MDLFAAILISITAVTICGICLFIFVCAFQPRFLRKLHGKAGRTFTDTESNLSSTDNQDQLSVKSLDAALESTSVPTDNRDKKLYLKSLERSLRTGRRIQDEEDNNDENQSHSNPLKFIRHCVNKHIRRKTSDAPETTDL